jgi:glycosyltransferase involved in cell wall biosynthesis
MEDLAGLDSSYRMVNETPKLRNLLLKVAAELHNGGYDLVHSHGFTSGVCTAVPALVFRTPHLMTSHDIINENQFLGVKGKAKKKLFGLMLGLIDAIHSVSEDAKTNLMEHFPALTMDERKCIVIPNGIEVERFANAKPRDLRSELGLAEDVFLIGFLGRFMSQKGFRYLVDAIELLRTNEGLAKRPLVLSFNEGAFIREEKQAVAEKGLSEYFKFLPFTPNVGGTIKGLDVVVMPSLWEACGLLAMEVLACGVPLIGSNCVGLREVLQNTPAKIVDRADAGSLSLALKQEILASSRESFEANIGWAWKKFDIRKTTQLIVSLYERMIQNYKA